MKIVLLQVHFSPIVPGRGGALRGPGLWRLPGGPCRVCRQALPHHPTSCRATQHPTGQPQHLPLGTGQLPATRAGPWPGQARPWAHVWAQMGQPMAGQGRAPGRWSLARQWPEPVQGREPQSIWLMKMWCFLLFFFFVCTAQVFG